MSRPAVSVIVPFLGSPSELAALVSGLTGLSRSARDEVIVVDNGPSALPDPGAPGVRVLWAGEVASSYHARNAGADAASGDWLAFLDADTEPIAGLLDAYLDPDPDPSTGILAGGVRDHPQGNTVAARMARRTGSMDQQQTLSNPYLPYAITANCAVRAQAFREAGGFEPRIRSGGDADLCWRLHRLGWGLEPRPAALVWHRNRETLSAVWRQRMRHGAGAAWLGRRYPGAMPGWGPRALAAESARRLGRAGRALVRGEARDAAVEAAVPTGWWAFEAGRRMSNEARVRHGDGWVRIPGRRE